MPTKPPVNKPDSPEQKLISALKSENARLGEKILKVEMQNLSLESQLKAAKKELKKVQDIPKVVVRHAPVKPKD